MDVGSFWRGLIIQPELTVFIVPDFEGRKTSLEPG